MSEPQGVPSIPMLRNVAASNDTATKQLPGDPNSQDAG